MPHILAAGCVGHARRWFHLFAAGTVLAGCAATPPHVDYVSLADRPRQDSWVTYALTDSIVAIGPPGASTSDKPPPPIDLAPRTVHCRAIGVCDTQILALATPTDFTGEVLAISPRSHGLVTTTLAPTYRRDSLRLATLSVEAHDHRIELINAIGTIAKGVIGLGIGSTAAGAVAGAVAAAPQQVALQLPITLDLAAIKASGTSAALPGNPGWSYTARFLDDPGRVGFLRRQQRGEVHGAFVSSVCRPLRLTLYAPSASVAMTVIVADPDWLQTVPLPAKGSITAHALCGADVSADAVTDIGVDDLATAFFAQVSAIHDASK